jgi:hypothetical protein
MLTLAPLVSGLLALAVCVLVLTGRLRPGVPPWRRSLPATEPVRIATGHQRETLCWTYETLLATSARCQHRNVINVESALEPEVILARLCLDCDEQLEPQSLDEPLPLGGTPFALTGRSWDDEPLMTSTRDDWDEWVFGTEECDCLEARYVTPGEAFDQVPVLDHKCFKNP